MIWILILIFCSELSIPELHEMSEENLNEAQDQMKSIMKIQVIINFFFFLVIFLPYSPFFVFG